MSVLTQRVTTKGLTSEEARQTIVCIDKEIGLHQRKPSSVKLQNSADDQIIPCDPILMKRGRNEPRISVHTHVMDSSSEIHPMRPREFKSEQKAYLRDTKQEEDLLAEAKTSNVTP